MAMLRYHRPMQMLPVSRRVLLPTLVFGVALLTQRGALADLAPRPRVSIAVLDSAHCPMPALKNAVEQVEAELESCAKEERARGKTVLHCSFDKSGHVKSCSVASRSGHFSKAQNECFRKALVQVQIPLAKWDGGSKPSLCTAQVQVESVIPPYLRPRPHGSGDIIPDF